MLPYFLGFFGGYLVGSIPTAYLLVKRRSNVDIRKAGSGNVGGYNVYRVTKSKRLGIAVGVVDSMKGLAVTLTAQAVWGTFWLTAVALLATVIGHSYPAWLRFKGGRGLASACGGLFAVGWAYIVVWCSIWVVVKSSGKEILTANILAIVLTPIVMMIVPDLWIETVGIVSADAAEYRWFTIVLSVILFATHVNGLPEMWSDIKRERASSTLGQE